MRVVLSQQKCVPGQVSDNIQTCLTKIKMTSERKPDLIVFPELSDTGYDLENMASIASSLENGLPISELKKAARTYQMAIVVGLSEKSADGLYNSAVVIDKQGEVIAHYRKIHLYTPNGEGVFKPGHQPLLFDFMGFKVGLNICYDIRFPEFARYLARQGANVLIVPTAWPFPRVEHWNLLTKARAIENQCYVIGVNRVGTDGGFTFCGNSRVVDPHGVLVASASEDQEELLWADLDQSRIDFIRKRQPIFDHLRNDLFVG